MRKYICLTALLFFSISLYSADLADFYSNVLGAFGVDDNAGRNSFLVLIIPSGGKYEGMGTAFTAVTLDSGFIDANPAGSSLMEKTEISLIHNNWIADSNLESAVFTIRKNNFGFGAAIKFFHLPFTGYNEWGATWERVGDSYTQGYYTETVATLNAAYTFFHSYYFDGIAVGASFKAGYRGVSASLATGQSAFSIMGDIGIITRFNFLKFYKSREKNFALGVSLKNVGVEFIDNSDPLPTVFSAGLSYSPFRPLTIAFDFNLPFNLNGETAELFSFATGFNINITSFISAQAGFLIKTGKPRLTMGTSLDLKNISLVYNYTLDLTTEFEVFDRMSLSLKINLGDMGRAMSRDTVQLLYLDGLELYAQGDLRKAVSLWIQCLEIDPSFTPAREMIATSEKTLQLEQEMNEKQTVE